MLAFFKIAPKTRRPGDRRADPGVPEKFGSERVQTPNSPRTCLTVMSGKTKICHGVTRVNIKVVDPGTYRVWGAHRGGGAVHTASVGGT